MKEKALEFAVSLFKKIEARLHEKILITGAFGFIGSHLAELFVRKGFEVIVFDRYNSNNNWGWLEHSKFKMKLK